MAPAPQRPTYRALALVVEDSLVNQEVAAEYLRSFGCRVEVAASGEEAVAKAEATIFDVIFMDCQMPGMDGYDATRHIRRRDLELDRHPCPIIALTANALRGDRDKCLAAGMDDYISKPFAEEALAAVLAKWVAVRRVGNAAPAEAAA